MSLPPNIKNILIIFPFYHSLVDEHDIQTQLYKQEGR